MTAGSADWEGFDYLPCPIPNYAYYVILGVFTCISLCGLVGNVGVVWLLGFHMKRNPFTVYVLNLAISDCSLLLVLLLCSTLLMISQVYCNLCDDLYLSIGIFSALFLFCYLAGMYLLTAMSVERCLAALFPLWYCCHLPKHLSGILCGGIWALAALSLLVLILTCGFTKSCAKAFSVLNILIFILFSSIPLLSNLVLFIKLRCGSQRRHPGKLYVAVLLSVLSLFIFGLPFTVSNFLLAFDAFFFITSLLLLSLNSSINPVLYFLVGSCQQCRFQCSVKVAFRRLFEEEATSEERSQVPGDAVMDTSV